MEKPNKFLGCEIVCKKERKEGERRNLEGDNYKKNFQIQFSSKNKFFVDCSSSFFCCLFVVIFKSLTTLVSLSNATEVQLKFKNFIF